jgi:hypothetical protein
VRYKYPVEIAVSPDLAESLAAAAANRVNIHDDLCTVYTVSPEFGCTCGVPALLADLAAALLGQRETVAAQSA